MTAHTSEIGHLKHHRVCVGVDFDGCCFVGCEDSDDGMPVAEWARATVVADPWIAAAQVHATLAVAEQLRAANVIAYVAAASSMSDGHKTWVEQEMGL